MTTTLPVCQPVLGEREIAYVLEALRAGEISGTAGRFIAAFEHRFAALHGCAYGVAVSSGTAALHIATTLANLQPAQEVLVNACTNIACGNAIAWQRAKVVPVDVEPDTWNMDPALLPDLVGPSTAAIMPVHIYGHPVEMDAVMRVAGEHNLFVIEDCCEAHGAYYHGQPVGSMGDVGCFSFYASKLIQCGEGGMLTTNRADLAARARSLRNLAFGEPRFVHQERGYNYRLTNLQAAIGLAQCDRLEDIVAAKRQIARWYTERLQGVVGLQLPTERPHVRNVYWMYGLVVHPFAFGCTRDTVQARLQQVGIETRTMFCPLNLQPALQDALVVPEPCLTAERLWHDGCYLPSSTTLTEADVDVICAEVRQCRG